MILGVNALPNDLVIGDVLNEVSIHADFMSVGVNVTIRDDRKKGGVNPYICLHLYSYKLNRQRTSRYVYFKYTDDQQGSRRSAKEDAKQLVRIIRTQYPVQLGISYVCLV
eukprot:GHVU01079571.1.p4 GENE.GHVU01079571.1~~GHVU01079571.1.p4  ORF type:complete len:110 (+),score=17.04 GHVU01079571.1:1765-2094(+)